MPVKFFLNLKKMLFLLKKIYIYISKKLYYIDKKCTWPFIAIHEILVLKLTYQKLKDLLIVQFFSLICLIIDYSCSGETLSVTSLGSRGTRSSQHNKDTGRGLGSIFRHVILKGVSAQMTSAADRVNTG